MGGRGASSGISDEGHEYGSQYHTVLKSGNIKFVRKNEESEESLLETMTKGRVYVLVGEKSENHRLEDLYLKSIIYFDNNNQRKKTIDLTHRHNGIQPHVHHGYFHTETETSKKGASHLTVEESEMVDRVREIWYSFIDKRK